MAKFVWDAARKKWLPHSVRRWSSPRGPAIHSDVLDALYAPFDGRRYDSKSQLRDAAKARGLECVGNDPGFLSPPAPQTKVPGGIAQDVARAYDEVSGR